jgi:hypothetical protein
MKKIISNANVNKLHTELNNAGIFPFPVLIYENGDCEITFEDDVDMVSVQAVIDAHNPEPLPEPLTDIEQLRLEQAQANAELFEMMLMLTGGGL